MSNIMRSMMADLGNTVENVMDAFASNNTRYLAVVTESQTPEEKKELDDLINKQTNAGVIMREYSNPLTLGIVETSNCLSAVYANKNAIPSAEDNYTLIEGIRQDFMDKIQTNEGK